MTISDWFGIALLLVLSALTVGIFVHIVISIGQLRRARAKKEDAGRSPPKWSTAQFEVENPLGTQKAALEDTQVLWNSLTKREKQVTHLAARGLTDAEIAATLSISERTVGNHLYNIYRKLNINSRRELKYVLRHLEDNWQAPAK
jgi:DNA-binding CsgD family transcriptional regulator